MGWRRRPIQWDRTKRLLYGSLLCLSPDNFHSTLLWATVENRDLELLTNKRMIDLRFPNGTLVHMFARLRVKRIMGTRLGDAAS